MNRRGVVVASTLAVCASIVVPAAAPPAAAVAAPAATLRQTLEHTVPALVRHATDLGALDPQRTLRVAVPLVTPHAAALDRFVTGLSTPGSPHYHRYVSPSRFGERFGAPAAEVGLVTRTLHSLGLQVEPPTANRLFVAASGPVSVLEQAFGTRLERLRLPSGRTFFANVTDLTLPADLVGAVTGVVGLDDIARFGPHLDTSGAARATRPQTSAAGPVGQDGGASPCPAAIAGAGYTAPQLASAYNFNDLYRKGLLGQGMSAALVEFDDYHDSNVAAMESCYRLHVPVVRKSVTGGSGGPPHVGEVEDMADITTMLEMLPKLDHLYVYVAPNTSLGEVELYNRFATDRLAPVLSSSWGNCEEVASAADNRLFALIAEEAAAQGQQIFEAAGDSGAVDCRGYPTPTSGSISVEQEAAVPWLTGVGGTDLGERTANGLPGPRDEASWNSDGAGGGGVSTMWPMPSWQRALRSARTAPGHSSAACGAPKSALCREVPDISADADPGLGLQGTTPQFPGDVGSPGYSIYCGTPNCTLLSELGLPVPPLPAVGGIGNWQPVGGTSLATPLVAAAAVLWDQQAKAAHLSGYGLLNPMLYRDATDPKRYARDFHDITTDSNDAQYDTADCPTGCNPHHLYRARKGYDMATGLGSFDAANLADSLVKQAGRVTVTPHRVTVYGYRHGVATTAPVVAGSGYRSASYTAHSNRPWLNVHRHGHAPGKVRWSVTPGALSAGVHHATVTVRSHGHAAKLHVRYEVSRRAKLHLSTHHLHFHEGALNSSGRPTIATCATPMWNDELFDAVNGSTGTKVAASSKSTLRISNRGPKGSRLHWQAFPETPLGSWLSTDLTHGTIQTRPGRPLVPTDGTAAGGKSDKLRLVSIANSNTLGGYPAMKQGTYRGDVKVYDLADPNVVRTVHATLTLGTGNKTPRVMTFVRSTALTVAHGKHTSFTLSLSDGSGTCGYDYSVATNRDWVRPSPVDSSGTVAPHGSGAAGGTDTGSGTGTVPVTVSAQHLSPGHHHFTLTVTSSDAAPSPDRIPFQVLVRKK